jgi:hypothetical protein
MTVWPDPCSQVNHNRTGNCRKRRQSFHSLTVSRVNRGEGGPFTASFRSGLSERADRVQSSRMPEMICKIGSCVYPDKKQDSYMLQIEQSKWKGSGDSANRCSKLAPASRGWRVSRLADGSHRCKFHPSVGRQCRWTTNLIEGRGLPGLKIETWGTHICGTPP